MIYIREQDSIIDIIEKIEKDPQEKIILYFPVGHPILHNSLSLKIIALKSKNKTLHIKTNDLVGRKICKNLWISLEKGKIEAGDNILKENYSSWEYIKYLAWGYVEDLQTTFWRYKKPHILTKKRQEFTLLQFLIFIPIGAFILFLCVYYFAINKSSITIYPEIQIKKEALNFILSDTETPSILDWQQHITLEKVQKKIYSSHRYSATDILNTEHTAQWKIEIYNSVNEQISIKPNTRFQNKDGIVFRSTDWAVVPAGSVDNFWEISWWSTSIHVIADSKDIHGNFVWERWNIARGTRLILPWLPIWLQEKIYAKNEEDFEWGNNETVRIVSQEDLETTRNLFQNKLKEESLKELQKEIDNRNNANRSHIAFLNISELITYTDEEITLESGIEVGTKTDTFSYQGSMVIEAYIYDTIPILQRLKVVYKEKSLEEIEKIKEIDEDSLRLSEIVNIQENPAWVKATFEILGTSYYDLSKQEHSSYINQLKSKIRGKEIREAENILINDPSIRNVEIKNRPFFIKNVSTIINNIEINVEL
jgi:hypothetical protein